jgi:lipoate-protein ligase A
MRAVLDVTLPTPSQNLACDDALLELCEDGLDREILRFWEPHEPFVVLGYSSKIQAEVTLPLCAAAGVPVLRRASGGGTVLQGPGCLNFALLLRIPPRGPLQTIQGTASFVLQRHRDALALLLGAPVTVEGSSDLAVGGLKCSGNAQRRKRRCVLFHGTFLLDADLELIEQLLPIPSRQPAYRRNRPHREFLTNLRIPAQMIKEALATAWQATHPFTAVPWQRIARLDRTVYATPAWTERW